MRPRKAGANDATDHAQVPELVLEQLPNAE